MIVNRLPELLAAKFGGKEKIVLQEASLEMKLTYSIVHRWANGKVERVDFPVLEKWCKYLQCQPGDIFIYIEE